MNFDLENKTIVRTTSENKFQMMELQDNNDELIQNNIV